MPVRRHPVALPNATPHAGPQAQAASAAPKASASLASLPLDHDLVASLRATYDLVRVHDSRLAEIFYAKLFTAAPHLRALFKSDPALQAAKLMAALDIVVRNLDAANANAALLADLGRRHATYGARPEHYAVVTDLLVQSMQELLGPRLTSEQASQWQLALNLIGRQMIAGAQGGGEQLNAGSVGGK
jgi:hemoglobin-like flavoprotein